MQQPILVIGATGNVGRALVTQLASAGHRVRAATRAPARLAVEHELVAPCAFDYDDPATFDGALDGVARLYLIAPPYDVRAHRRVIPFIDRAAARGVERFVFLSGIGVEAYPELPLRSTELHIESTGVPYGFLRPNFFMENFSPGWMAGMIKRKGKIMLPAGEAKTSFVACQDIAAAAAALLCADALEPQVVTLTGPEALDHAEVAALLSTALGRPVRYAPVSEEQMAERMRARGASEENIDYLKLLYAGVRAGHAARVLPDLERLIGRPATRFEEYARALL